MHRIALAPGALIVAAAILGARAASAQDIPLSQEAAVRQRIANTWIEIRYRRPVARGRTLFGGVVEWRRVWTPGADSATTISASTPIHVEGEPLPAGTYSVWMIPDSAAAWTVIFSRVHAVFHTRYPGERSDRLRVRVTPRDGPHMETLLWYFPVVNGAEATLIMHWGTTGVPLRVRVPEP